MTSCLRSIYLTTTVEMYKVRDVVTFLKLTIDWGEGLEFSTKQIILSRHFFNYLLKIDNSTHTCSL